jgi:hypothetical protein
MGSSAQQSWALCLLALIKKDSGDFSGAKDDASESQRVAKIAGNLLTETFALYAEACSWLYLGSYGCCISLLARAIHLLDLCGLSGGTLHSSILNLQAEVHRCKSEYVKAHNIHVHLLKDMPGEQNPFYHALALSNIAQIDVEIGGLEDDVEQKY